MSHITPAQAGICTYIIIFPQHYLTSAITVVTALWGSNSSPEQSCGDFKDSQGGHEIKELNINNVSFDIMD